MLSRRELIQTSAVLGGAHLLQGDAGQSAATDGSAAARRGRGALPRVATLDGSTLPFEMQEGVKVFRLVAQPVVREFAPGMNVQCWGYNGQTPGPTIECFEGDRVRILVKNELPEPTTVHWHGIFLPNGMDGVGGLNQPYIEPGETWGYEFTLRQHGTFLYHPHADETVQIGVGMMGFFVVHPRAPEEQPASRDFAIFLHQWAIEPGTSRPDPSAMDDFNLFTFNGKVYPATSPLVVRTGDRVRVRFANLSMHHHPIHLHGHAFRVTATDGGPIPTSAQWPMTTVLVPVGSTRTVEFVADAPGDWPFHCHMSHHAMNAMGHGIPNTLGVDQGAREGEGSVEDKIREHLPGYMAMGATGMGEHSEHAKHMQGPRNTLPMMMGDGPFGPIAMGGMFTILKVRDELRSYDEDAGWYQQPEGTRAYRVS